MFALVVLYGILVQYSIDVFFYKQAHTHTHTLCVLALAHTHAQTHTYTHIHTHIHTHTHTHTHRRGGDVAWRLVIAWYAALTAPP